MRVEKLSIENFRGIGKLKLEFPNSKPVVFIGTNGSGKSSVLDALYAVLHDLDAHLKHLTDLPSQLGREDTRIGTSSARITVDTLVDENRLKWILGTNPTTNNTSGRSWSYTDSGTFVVNYQTIRRVRDVPLFIDKLENDPLGALEDETFAPESEIDFHRFFLWLRYREDKENEQRIDDSNYRDVRLQAVRQAIESTMPQFSNLRVRRNPDRLMLSKKQGGSESEFNINQMSDGEKGLLALIGDIARRLAIAHPDLDNPLNGTAQVLIDEIELHLHPEWQRTIVPALIRTFPNCQFFLTTHSPQVLSELEDAHVFLLRPSSNPDEGITATEVHKLYGRDSNRILEDVMGVSARPAEIKEDLSRLFRLIDDGDLKAARKLRNDLSKRIYAQEPDFVTADLLIRKKEILGR